MNQEKSIIVISRHKKDLKWSKRLVNEGFHVLVYDHTNHNNHPYFLPENRGREASVYLRYIIDYYDHLTPYTIFVQDEEESWHHKGSLVDLIQHRVGKQNKFYNLNNRCMALIKLNRRYPEMKEYFDKYLSPYIGPMKKYGDWTAGYKCCAQFIVHKDYIRRFPKKMYEDMYEYMMDGKHEDGTKARMFEWTLHMLYDNPYIIHGMTEEEFKKKMHDRISKIHKQSHNNDKIYIDDCKIIIDYD